MGKSPGCPEWRRLPEACRLFLRGVTARAAAPIALVVGTLLSAVNQGAVVFGGNATVATWLQVGFNYAVPFVVPSVGFLAAGRVPPSRRDQGRDQRGASLAEQDRTTHR